MGQGADVWGALASLLLAALVVMGSPGPTTMSVVAVGAVAGFRGALPYLAAVSAGTVVVLVALAVGTASLLWAVPGLAPALLAASAVYMVWLAWRIATAPPLSAPGAAPPSAVGGFLLAVANPKAWLALGAVVAGNRLALAPPAFEVAVRIGLLAAMVVLVHLAWLAAGTALARHLRRPRTARIVQVAMAVLLLATTVAALRGPLTPP